MTDYAIYIRKRVTELRMKKGVSEYQMSLDLGQNKNYIQGITSGKALPSLNALFNICDYFGITPIQFFDGHGLYPELVRKAMDSMTELDETDLLLIINIIDRLKSNRQKK